MSNMARRAHGVCEGYLWRHTDRTTTTTGTKSSSKIFSFSSSKSSSSSSSTSVRTYDYCVLVGVRLFAYENYYAYQKSAHPVVTFTIVGASSAAIITPTNSSSTSDSTTTTTTTSSSDSSFRLVSDQGTHVHCTAPSTTCREVWLASLQAGLEYQLIQQEIEEQLRKHPYQFYDGMPSTANMMSGKKCFPIAQSLLTPGNSIVSSTVIPPTPPKPRYQIRNNQGKYCTSCGKMERFEFPLRYKASPLPQYRMEFRVDLCPKCVTAQGVLDHVQFMLEMYKASGHERNAILKARKLCIAALTAGGIDCTNRMNKNNNNNNNSSSSNGQSNNNNQNENDNSQQQQQQDEKQQQYSMSRSSSSSSSSLNIAHDDLPSIEELSLAPNSHWLLGQVIQTPQFLSYQRLSPTLETLNKQFQQGFIGVMEFLEVLDHAIGKRDASLSQLKTQAFRVAGDMGTALKLLQEQALSTKKSSSSSSSSSSNTSNNNNNVDTNIDLANDTEMLQCLLEFLLDLAEEGELQTLAFFWPQLCHIHLRMLPPENASELARVELVEDFLLTVATRYSVHMGIQLIWSHMADLEDSFAATGAGTTTSSGSGGSGSTSGGGVVVGEASSIMGTSTGACILKRRFALLRFICELESLLFDFDNGWGGGSVCLGQMLTPSMHQVSILRDLMMEISAFRYLCPDRLSRSVRLDQLEKTKQRIQQQHLISEQKKRNSKNPPTAATITTTTTTTSADDTEQQRQMDATTTNTGSSTTTETRSSSTTTSEVNLEQLAKEALRIAKNADYLSTHLAFTKRLCDIAEQLRFLDISGRPIALKSELAKLNSSGTMGGDPLNIVRGSLTRVVRVPISEGHVFRSKERTPVLLLLECVKDDEGIILSNEDEEEEKAEKQNNDDKDDRNGKEENQQQKQSETIKERQEEEKKNEKDDVTRNNNDNMVETSRSMTVEEEKSTSENDKVQTEEEDDKEDITSKAPIQVVVDDDDDGDDNKNDCCENDIQEHDENNNVDSKENETTLVDSQKNDNTTSTKEEDETTTSSNKNKDETIDEQSRHRLEGQQQESLIVETNEINNNEQLQVSFDDSADFHSAHGSVTDSLKDDDDENDIFDDAVDPATTNDNDNSNKVILNIKIDGVMDEPDPSTIHALRRFDSPKSEPTVVTPKTSKESVEQMVTNVVAKQLHLPGISEMIAAEENVTDDDEVPAIEMEEDDDDDDDDEEVDETQDTKDEQEDVNNDSNQQQPTQDTHRPSAKKMSALGINSGGESKDSVNPLAKTGETRREVLNAIMMKGMSGSNTIAAGATTAVQRHLQDFERRRAVELLLTGGEPNENEEESTRQELLSLGIRSVSSDPNLSQEKGITGQQTEEDEAMEAVRLLLIQYRVAQGELSVDAAAEALVPQHASLNLINSKGSSDRSKPLDPRELPQIDAGDVDERLVGCGVLPPAVLQALTLWKGGMVTNGELLELIKKDLEYVRISVALEQNKNKLFEDSVFWGRFAFGERWAEKQARIAASSPEASQKGWDLVGVIVKSNDDLRQEAFVMQLIELCQEAFQEAGLELWLHPYRILSTGRSTGIIEMVRNAMSFDALKKRPGYGKGGLREHLQRMTDFSADPGEAFKSAQRNFVRSLAAYSLLSYLFLFKDRHNGNILLDTSGHVIHIDFGFIFGIAPGGSFSLEMSTPFKLTEEMIEVMDGLRSSLFSEFVTLFCCGFLALQAHCDTFLTIVEITCAGSTFKCFEGKDSAEVTAKLRERFCPDLGKEDTIAFALDIIKQATQSYGTKQYDYFQYLSQGIAT